MRIAVPAVRRHIPVVTKYSQTEYQKPTTKGLTTATVVGPEGEEIFTNHGLQSPGPAEVAGRRDDNLGGALQRAGGIAAFADARVR